MKLLLFDVDQTLISTGGAGLRALDRAFKQLMNLENAIEGISPSGKTDPSIVREIFLKRIGADEGMDDALGALLEAYVSFLSEEVRQCDAYQVLPGVTETLDELMSRDVMVGLATGNVEAGARIKLERGNLNRYFLFGGFGSDSENRAALVRRAAERAAARCGAAIDPSDTFVIGDTPLDVLAGQQAGFKTIGVATGRYSQAELRDAGADSVMSDFKHDRAHFYRATFME